MSEAVDIAQLREWIGRSTVTEDEVTAFPVAALAATLDRDDPSPVPGDELPPLWHWLYFLPLYRTADAGPDGHIRRGGFLPPVPLPRRMWAGGRLEFRRSLRVGEKIRRRSVISDVSIKRGRSGTLVFVLVRHEISGVADQVAVVEEHDIVYREAARPGTVSQAPDTEPDEAVWSRTLVPDDLLLFRYSALTFNGHRIHYDRRYATEVEGYPGLIVHGPLLATLLIDLVRRELPDSRISAFRFRAMAPVFDGHAVDVCGRPDERGARLWIRDARGRVAMDALAEFG